MLETKTRCPNCHAELEAVVENLSGSAHDPDYSVDLYLAEPVGQEARLVPAPCQYCRPFATAQERQECAARREAERREG